MAVPGHPSQPRAAGTNQLISGRRRASFATPADVAEELGLAERVAPQDRAERGR